MKPWLVAAVVLAGCGASSGESPASDAVGSSDGSGPSAGTADISSTGGSAGTAGPGTAGASASDESTTGGVETDAGGSETDATGGQVVGTGFELRADPWTVPTQTGLGGTNEGFYSVSSSVWGLLDLDGDGALELVSTGEDPSNSFDDSRMWGYPDNPHWRVYDNVGDGFATEATQWSGPGETGTEGVEGFHRLASNLWAVADLDSDGLPDLISTSQNPPETEMGLRIWGYPDQPHWRVYRNLGDSFSATPTTWAMPSETGLGGANEGFYTLSTSLWSLLDIDGDGALELVSTGRNPADVFGESSMWGYPDNPHWRVYENLGDGFATAAVEWSGPSETGLGGAEGYYTASASLWTVADLDTDGLPDLVSTGENPTDTSGNSRVWGSGDEPHWRLYRNTGDGFSQTPVSWPVPTQTGVGGTNEGFHGPASSNWGLLDLDGDGAIELVSAGQNPNDVFGESSMWGYPDDTHWRVYDNVGDGFSLRHDAWPGPSETGLQGAEGFDGMFRNLWTVTDIDADGLPDLVSTGQNPTDTAGDSRVWGTPRQPHWRVYRNRP